MPAAELRTTVEYRPLSGDAAGAKITLENRGTVPAVLVRASVLRGVHGPEVPGVIWDDDYVTLLPGETRTLTASYSCAALSGAKPVVQIVGHNVAEQLVN